VIREETTMSDPTSFAMRALQQLPNLDAVADELAAPAAVLRRVAGGRPRSASPAFEVMADVADAESAAAEQVLADGRRAVVKLRQMRDRPPPPPLTPGEQIGLEAVILLFGRPALLVQNGTFPAPPTGWEALDANRQQIESSLKSVGRIDLLNRGMLGTGFLVAPNVVMTNRHVAEVFSLPSDTGGWSFKLGRTPAIDYLEESGSTGSATFKVRKVIGIHPDVRIDLALLEVEPTAMPGAPAGFTVPAVLPIAGTEPVVTGTDFNVYLVGYPASDNQGITPPDVLSRIFGDVLEVKRLQPGTMTSISSTLPRFSHDCSTLGGNSGSCVIALDTHQVIGLHFSGGYRESNFAVALWRLTEDPLLLGAGVKFSS
jgi:V8-like Glu-specific endopeptidase